MSARERRYAQRAGKNDANNEEMIADGGFGFQAKVKVKSSHLYLYSTFNNTNCVKASVQYQNRFVSFLKPEKVNWYSCGKNTSAVTDSQFSFAFLFVFILKSLSLLFISR